MLKDAMRRARASNDIQNCSCSKRLIVRSWDTANNNQPRPSSTVAAPITEEHRAPSITAMPAAAVKAGITKEATEDVQNAKEIKNAEEVPKPD
jgi:hypothetical protein